MADLSTERLRELSALDWTVEDRGDYSPPDGASKAERLLGAIVHHEAEVLDQGGDGTVAHVVCREDAHAMALVPVLAREVLRLRADLRSEEIRADASLLRAERAEAERDTDTDTDTDDIDTAFRMGVASASDELGTLPPPLREECPYPRDDTRRRWWLRGYSYEARLHRAMAAKIERDEAMEILGAGREYLVRDGGVDLVPPVELPTTLVERALHVVEALAAESGERGLPGWARSSAPLGLRWTANGGRGPGFVEREPDATGWRWTTWQTGPLWWVHAATAASAMAAADAWNRDACPPGADVPDGPDEGEEG